MDIKVLDGIYNASLYKGNEKTAEINRNESFEDFFQSALNMVKETNGFTNASTGETVGYLLGATENMHDLPIAQQKATLSLQYTVAVRNKVLEAYKEIMNLQF